MENKMAQRMGHYSLLGMIARFGFSITVRKRATTCPGIFISGLSLASGQCCPILPFREGDYVPVWATLDEVRWIIEEARDDEGSDWDYRTVAISSTLRAGSSGASPFDLFKGVAGFIIPDVAVPERATFPELPAWGQKPEDNGTRPPS